MMSNNIKYLINQLNRLSKGTDIEVKDTLRYAGTVLFNEYYFAADVLKLSNKYAPKDTGYMISTGKVLYFDDKIVFSYSAWYSGYVHEIVGNKHKKGKTAKFLELAFIETCIKYGVYIPYEVSVGDFGLELSFNV